MRSSDRSCFKCLNPNPFMASRKAGIKRKNSPTDKGKGIELSLVIPIHNHASYVEETTRKYAQALAASPLVRGFEIILVSNNCSDATPQICERLARSIPHVRHFDYPFKTLKGGAVIRGFGQAHFSVLGFTDADMATSPEQFLKLIPPLLDNPRMGAAIASRQVAGAVMHPAQPFFRRFLGQGFSILRELFFDLGIKDSQCGAKLFRKEALLPLELKTNGFAFDVELLYRVRQNGFMIAEIPVIWNDRAGSTVKLFSPIHMLIELISLRLRV